MQKKVNTIKKGSRLYQNIIRKQKLMGVPVTGAWGPNQEKSWKRFVSEYSEKHPGYGVDSESGVVINNNLYNIPKEKGLKTISPEYDVLTFPKTVGKLTWQGLKQLPTLLKAFKAAPITTTAQVATNIGGSIAGATAVNAVSLATTGRTIGENVNQLSMGIIPTYMGEMANIGGYGYLTNKVTAPWLNRIAAREMSRRVAPAISLQIEMLSEPPASITITPREVVTTNVDGTLVTVSNVTRPTKGSSLPSTAAEIHRLQSYFDKTPELELLIPRDKIQNVAKYLDDDYMQALLTPGNYLYLATKNAAQDLYWNNFNVWLRNNLMKRKYELSTRSPDEPAFELFPMYGRALSEYDNNHMAHFGMSPESYNKVMQQEFDKVRHGGLIGFNKQESTSTSSTPMYINLIIRAFRLGKIAKPYVDSNTRFYNLNSYGRPFYKTTNANGRVTYRLDPSVEGYDIFGNGNSKYIGALEYVDNVLIPKYDELRQTVGASLEEIPNPYIENNLIYVPSILSPKLKFGGRLNKKLI